MDWEVEARKLTFDRDLVHEIAALAERAALTERAACAKIAEDVAHMAYLNDSDRALT